MTGVGDIVLASTSDIRRRLLASAGIAVRSVPPRVDEAAIKRTFGQVVGTDIRKLADVLAAAKAEAVSSHDPAAVVIGADQILLMHDRPFDKPQNLQEAWKQLSLLRGNTHHLITAVAVARRGAVVWNDRAVAKLTMRHFSDEFLAGYLASLGKDALTSVGAYQLEGRGVQLFDDIDGDYFAILGLPLLPLLSFLRREGCLPE
ncbi:MAG: Maf family protein [Aestuariivirgaceae bacterium]